jgi:hypothetical protein
MSGITVPSSFFETSEEVNVHMTGTINADGEFHVEGVFPTYELELDGATVASISGNDEFKCNGNIEAGVISGSCFESLELTLCVFGGCTPLQVVETQCNIAHN